MSEKFVQSLVLLTLAQWPVFGQDARLPDGAKLVFEDAFNRKKLGSFAQGFIKPEDRAKLNWCVRKGTWEIRFEKDGNNGYLFGKGGPAEIVLDKNLRSNLRLEYTAWSTNPGDRSAFLCVPLPNFRYEDIYGFHFAGGYSKYNVLVRKRRSMTQQAKSPLPKAGQKWRVAVQKADSLLQMIVDGKAVFSVKDPEYHALRDKLTTAQGTCIGLYTWSDGMCFDDLKVFNLPETRGEQLPKDAEVTYSLWQGLENVKEGQLPDGLHLKAGPSCSVRVIDEPTVVYRPKPKGQEMVRDRCLELKDDRMGKDELASITIPIEPISTGEVEAELLAWSYEGACAELSLVDKDGKELASLVVGENGAFFAKTPGGVQKLKDRISYLNRPRNARFYLQPKRWFTFRLSFNADAGVYHASVVNLYLGLGRPGVGFVPLGSDIPMLGKRKVCGVRLSTLGKAHLLADNFCAASPRAMRINGKSPTVPLREILGLSFPLRKDPISLSVYSLRNEISPRVVQPHLKNRFRLKATETFYKAASVFDRLLLRQALLEERRQVLVRTLYHLEQSGAGAKVTTEDRAVLERISLSFEELDRVLSIYGKAFRDALNEQTLDHDFYPAAQIVESKLSALEKEADALGKSCLAAAGGKLEPAPALAKGPYEAPLKWRDRRFERGGKPALFYPPVGCRSSDMIDRGNAHKLLELDNCWAVPWILDRTGQPNRTDTTTFSWDAFDRYMATYVVRDNPEASIGVQSPFGMHYLSQICPAWWFEKHKDNPDILFRDPNGKAPNWTRADKPYAARKLNKHGRYVGGGGYWARLNFWNPEVRKMYRSMFEEWSRTIAAKYPGRAIHFAVGLEGAHSAITETGFNQSAVAAFRVRLKEKYKTVEALNKVWNSEYASIDAIDPRQYSSKKPNGLMYEFQSFRHEGYWEWMDLMQASLKKHLPDTVFLNDFHNALDRGHRSGMDGPGMFKCYDVVGNHYYGKPASQPVWMHRLLDSLRKAYGTALGNFEWVGDVRCSDIFDQHATKNSALLEMFEQMAWGRSVLSIWYGGSAGFAEGAQYWLPALHQSVLRYSTMYIPIGRLRSRRFGEIALTNPTIGPRLAIMEATTSFLNGIDVRTAMQEAAIGLGKKEWNFGFVHEAPLLEGKQSLEGIKTLILPRGICLKRETSKKLLTWIGKGGSLICLLPPGVYNQFGQPDGTLVRTVMGDIDFALNEDFSQMTITAFDKSKVASKAIGNSGAMVLQAEYGKGRLLIYAESTPFPEDHLLKLVANLTPRDVWTSGRRFRVVVRESPKHFYLFVVNPDYLHPQEDTVNFSGEYRGAVDLGCDAAFPVNTMTTKGTTAFKLRLHPGEGTVIRLAKVLP